MRNYPARGQSVSILIFIATLAVRADEPKIVATKRADTGAANFLNTVMAPPLALGTTNPAQSPNRLTLATILMTPDMFRIANRA